MHARAGSCDDGTRTACCARGTLTHSLPAGMVPTSRLRSYRKQLEGIRSEMSASNSEPTSEPATRGLPACLPDEALISAVLNAPEILCTRDLVLAQVPPTPI